MMRLWLLVAAILFGAGSAHADDIVIGGAWSRATPSAGGAAVVYLTAQDNGDADVLIGAETPVAGHAELHETRMADGIMSMAAVPSLQISPDSPIVLAPNSYHLMLTGLKRRLSEGETFPLTLVFQKAGRVEGVVRVLEPGATNYHQ